MENTNENMTIADEVLDSAWGDEDDMESGGEAGVQQDATTNTAGNEPAAEQQPTAPAEQEPGQPADQPDTAPELITLNIGGETKQVTRDELIAMAQRGADYDAVLQERDQLRQYKQEADPAMEIVKGYAQRNGMSMGDYLDFCRTQQLMRSGMSEQDAKVKLSMEKERAALDAQEARINADKAQQDTLLKQTQARQEARKKDMDAFLKAYPDVKAGAIPKEVWAAVAQGDSLVNAYTMHENKRLTAELAAERQNKANREKSPGSLGGNAGPEQDEIDRLWAEDD